MCVLTPPRLDLRELVVCQCESVSLSKADGLELLVTPSTQCSLVRPGLATSWTPLVSPAPALEM